MIDPLIAAIGLFSIVAALGLSLAQPAPVALKVRADRRTSRRG